MNAIIKLLALSILIGGNLSPRNATSAENVGQLGTPVLWIPVPNSPDQFYLAQRTRDDRLILTPNEAFFPKRGLSANGTGDVPDINNLNGGKSFATIEKWDAGDIAEWGLFFEKAGRVNVTISMSAMTPNDRFSLKLGEKTRPVKIGNMRVETVKGEKVLTATMMVDVPKAGFHSVKLVCDKAVSKIAFQKIEVAGTTAANGAVIRKRWRPAAAHTKFSNSQTPERVRLWVMEMDAIPGELGFYSPITTPFGYYGPTWQADGTVNSGFNFSLWSYGRGKAEPPVDQLSHLLAIGNRDAKFSGFGHEGTGVKIRNWEPLAGRQGQKQVIALRVQPGEKYDTYFSYFYESDRKRWQLFGVGNKFNKGKPLKSLWVGSFVEVPGPPPVQRTGPYERTMRYRGWVMNEAGKWFPLDRMANGNVDRKTGYTHTDRGLTDDGWFYLQTGGWTFRKATGKGFVQLDADANPAMPDYLDVQEIAYLTSIPSTITASIKKHEGNSVRGTYTVRNAREGAEVRVYWGSSEGLTFADRWQNNKILASPREGKNRFVIDDAPAGQPVYVRLLLKNDEGQFWTSRTVVSK